MKIIKLFTSLLFLYLGLSCSKSMNKKRIEKQSDLYLDISIKNSLNKDSIYGDIKYHFKINDTLKIVEKDKRYIYFIAAIESMVEDKNKEDVLFEKEINLEVINVKDTILIPFKFKKTFKGKANVFGGVNDNLILNSYPKSKGKIRLKTYEHTFKENVYIK